MHREKLSDHYDGDLLFLLASKSVKESIVEMKARVKDCTYYSEVHNFEDPDGESKVDHYEDHEE